MSQLIENLEEFVLKYYQEPTKEKKLGDTLVTRIAEIKTDLQELFLKKVEAIQTNPNIDVPQTVKEILAASEELRGLIVELENLKSRHSGLAPMVANIEKGAQAPQAPKVLQPQAKQPQAKQANPAAARVAQQAQQRFRP